MLTPAKNVPIEDLKLILLNLPKNGETVKRIIAFVGQQETKFFKPAPDNEPLEFLLFEWVDNNWILRL